MRLTFQFMDDTTHAYEFLPIKLTDRIKWALYIILNKDFAITGMNKEESDG